MTAKWGRSKQSDVTGLGCALTALTAVVALIFVRYGDVILRALGLLK